MEESKHYFVINSLWMENVNASGPRMFSTLHFVESGESQRDHAIRAAHGRVLELIPTAQLCYHSVSRIKGTILEENCKSNIDLPTITIGLAN